MKAVVFESEYWHKKLWPRIIEENGAAVRISWVCRQRLGFTVREHTWYEDVDGFLDRFTDIRLDFYDEALRTMFLLKYK